MGDDVKTAETQQGKGVKRIDFEKSYFYAQGKKYNIENAYSIARYSMYQILEKELGFSTSFKQLFDDLVKLRQLLNKTEFVDGAVLLNNMITGCSNVSHNQHTALKMCALFCNTDDEDRTKITDDLIEKKIEDWTAEGYDIKDFFTLALNTINGYIEIYKSLTQSTTQVKEKVEATN